jgi:hypothetical protein
MARSPLLLGAFLGLAQASGLAAVALRGPLDQGPVYTVAQVQAQLWRQPGAWAGRTVRVRGVATEWCMPGYSRCLLPHLSDPDLEVASEPLLLAWAAPDPLLAFVRRVPLLGDPLPAPQAVDWWEVATYRVELRATPDEACGAATCYEALLLDGAP